MIKTDDYTEYKDTYTVEEDTEHSHCIGFLNEYATLKEIISKGTDFKVESMETDFINDDKYRVVAWVSEQTEHQTIVESEGYLTSEGNEYMDCKLDIIINHTPSAENISNEYENDLATSKLLKFQLESYGYSSIFEEEDYDEYGLTTETENVRYRLITGKKTFSDNKTVKCINDEIDEAYNDIKQGIDNQLKDCKITESRYINREAQIVSKFRIIQIIK